MNDRALLFLVSLLLVLASLAALAWLVVSGQAASLDGLFLAAVCLLTAAAFSLYLWHLISGSGSNSKPGA